MNGQIVLYMECYLPICSNRLSNFIVLTGAYASDCCQFRWLFLYNKRGRFVELAINVTRGYYYVLGDPLSNK